MSNPFTFAFSGTNQPNALLYAQPGGLVVAGRDNRYAFEAVRQGGGEVLAYLCPVEFPKLWGELDKSFYTNPTFWGSARTNNGNPVLDLSVNSTWSNWVVAYVENLIKEKRVDGVYLDVVGARLWATSGWDTWPVEEQVRWTKGNVDLVRRIDSVRRRLDPSFIVMTNNLWGEKQDLSRAGEQYIDGIAIEHHAPNAHKQEIAGRPYGGPNRRVLAIARTGEAGLWVNVPGVTHISDDRGSYLISTPPAVPFMAVSPTVEQALESLRAEFERVVAEKAALEQKIAQAKAALA